MAIIVVIVIAVSIPHAKMMSPNARVGLLVVAVVLSAAAKVSSAFSPSSLAPGRMNVNIGSLALSVPGPRIALLPLRMSAEEEAERLRAQAAKLREEVAEATGKSAAETAAPAPAKQQQQQVQVNADGTIYDDEMPEYRDPLSDSMRTRLMREASSGLDSEKKQSNVILYISVAVAVLVLLGGQGILY